MHPAAPACSADRVRRIGNSFQQAQVRRDRNGLGIRRCTPRFAAQHRGLISHADRLQMHIGVEPGRMRAFEFQGTPVCRRRGNVVTQT
jgi:hypothetical protein